MVDESISCRRFSIKYSFSVTSVNITINDTVLKTRFFGLHFLSETVFNRFDVIGPESYQILCNNAKFWYLWKASMQLSVTD